MPLSVSFIVATQKNHEHDSYFSQIELKSSLGWLRRDTEVFVSSKHPEVAIAICYHSMVCNPNVAVTCCLRLG